MFSLHAFLIMIVIVVVLSIFSQISEIAAPKPIRKGVVLSMIVNIGILVWTVGLLATGN